MTFNQRARLMVAMRLDGYTYREIGERFNVNHQRAHQVVGHKINALMSTLYPPEIPEDQYLADAIINSPYLCSVVNRSQIIFLDNEYEQ